MPSREQTPAFTRPWLPNYVFLLVDNSNTDLFIIGFLHYYRPQHN